MLCSSMLFSQSKNPLLVSSEQVEHQKKWVDSLYNSMSLQERIGQLYIVDIFSQAPKANTDRIKEYIKEYHIGGVIFSKGGPQRQAKLHNEYQEISKVPLLIGMDAEWGLAMRLDSTFAYPWNMTLGAVQDNELIEQVGTRIGEHNKRLGVHINFAPSVDINNNPKNPIIGNRSFGEIPEMVTQKARAFARGMEGVSTLSSLKHFPGHGNTDQDSHLGLPTIQGNLEDLNQMELYPYRQLLQENLSSSVMTSHLNVPALDASKTPSSLSYKIITGVLKEQYGFQGLIFTDALNMKGATAGLAPGEADLKAFLAGSDILLIPENLPKSQELLLKACQDGTITEERLAHSVKKILMAKYKVGLQDYQPVERQGLYEDLNTLKDTILYQKVMEEAISIIKNKEEVLPFTGLENKNIAYVALGDDQGIPFLEGLKKYTQITQVKRNSLAEYQQELKEYSDVIIGLHKKNNNPWQSYKFSAEELYLLKELAKQHKVHLVVFTSPYSLLEVETEYLQSITVAYQNSVLTQEIVPQILFGALPAKGKLPVGAGNNFPAGFGIETEALKRLGYSLPERVGVNGKTLKKIDSLIAYGLKEKMMPGVQVLVARNGKVIYDKSFGKHRYNQSSKAVENQDIYDLASLTKILATLPLIMELVDKGELNLETRLDEMLPEYKGNPKGQIQLIDLLTHFNRLQAWIPFYRETLDPRTKDPDAKYYQKTYSKEFSIPVAQNLYMRTAYRDSIYKRILESDLRPKKSYRYSDLPFYLLQKYIENYYKKSLDELASTHFYKKIGADKMGFLPLKKFSKDRIPPTENDNYFRQQEIQGFVHDQGAAMMGGVAGHAGLFANANDIAKMMQMFIWEGTYGDIEFISPSTFQLFNTCYYCDKDIRRGIGFDKPQLGDVGPTCGCVSMTSFGHSGFTGTFTWADPELNIVYVFLSNRTFPDAENSHLIRSNLRSNIQAVIYEAIEDSFVN